MCFGCARFGRMKGQPLENNFWKLHLNTPAGRWFPALQDLTCALQNTSFCTSTCSSPYLKSIFIFTLWSWKDSEAHSRVLLTITSAISLPTSTLQLLVVAVNHHKIPWTYFKDSLSATILHYGALLTEFTSLVPPSDAAVDHLIQLPHLHTLQIVTQPLFTHCVSTPRGSQVLHLWSLLKVWHHYLIWYFSLFQKITWPAYICHQNFLIKIYCFIMSSIPYLTYFLL